jgi:hypothetical protein
LPALEDQQHLVALHQLARLLHGLRRTEGVVVADEGDLATVDAALFIDFLEIGRLGLADHPIGGCRSAIGHDIADLDFGIARAGIVFLLRVGRGCGDSGSSGKRHHGKKASDTRRHRSLPTWRLF